MKLLGAVRTVWNSRTVFAKNIENLGQEGSQSERSEPHQLTFKNTHKYQQDVNYISIHVQRKNR